MAAPRTRHIETLLPGGTSAGPHQPAFQANAFYDEAFQEQIAQVAFQESGFQPQAFQKLTGHFAFQPGAFQQAAFEEIPQGFSSLAFQGPAFQILLEPGAAAATVEIERPVVLTLQAVNRSSVH